MENELNENIKKLWLSGLTAGQVAKELNVTRSCVMGRVHRMQKSNELGIREADLRMRNIREETRRLESERLALLPDILRESPYEKVEEPSSILAIFDAPAPEKTPLSSSVRFEKLTYMSCRYVLNDGDPKDFLFCGKTKKGRAYCEEHEAICYYKIERKGKTNVFKTR